MKDTKWENTCNQVLRIMPVKIKSALRQAIGNNEHIKEIVLRANKPVCVYTFNDMFYLTYNGCLTGTSDSQPLIITSISDITECFNMACGYSVYSHMNEIKEGFITISGGHRAGICGTAVVDSGEITNIRDVSSISVRVCREVVGCGKDVVSLIRKSSEGLIICGVPCSGKTTVLRDVARILSFSEGRRVSLIDSRGELASVYKGVPQLDAGLCDVLDSYPRAQGIIQALKVLSPEFILCDEISSEEDGNAILSGLNSGVRFVTTSHAGSYEEFLKKPFAKTLLSTGAFEYIVFLKGRELPGCIDKIVELKKV